MEKFVHKHSLGQNFLQDRNVLLRIIDAVDVEENDLVLEVGPGHGALTKYLKLYKAQVLCFEIDERVKKYLGKYLDHRTNVLYGDFLKADLPSILKEYSYDNLYLIANLPYYITTPIIEKVINSKIDIKAMVLMVQNEMADRLVAKPGSRDYGALSVYLSYYFDLEKLFFVDRKCFDPVPNVDSAVIKLSSKKKKLVVQNEDLFFKLVKDAFRQKRKTIKNNLTGYDLEKVLSVLESYGMDLSVRAEQISLDCFVDMANILSQLFVEVEEIKHI